ncbi:MAG: hypothetical protein ACI4TK_11950 [Agathobacter sp.]
MKTNDLLDIIGDANDEFIHDAKANQKQKVVRFPNWAKWSSAIAVCLVLVIGIGSVILPRMGGASSHEGSAGDSGHENGSVFMSYAGPVFPLTLLEENESISAERNITLDFAPWMPVWISNEEEAASHTNLTEEERQDVLQTYNEWYPDGGYYQSSGDIVVTDSYTLTNTAATNQTIRVLYPFASNLQSIDKTRPVLTIGENTLDTKLHVGSYAGGFQGAWENGKETQQNPGSLNLQEIKNWEDYQSLLSDGTYLERALGDFVDLSYIPVTLYVFTDAWGPEENDDAGIPNPSIRVMFEMDYEKTTVLSYNFNGGYYDSDNGIMGKIFSILEEWERDYDTPSYLIVIGDDVENLQYQGYVTGGWDTKKTIDAGVTITRTETNLEEALRQAASYNYQKIIDENNYFELTAEYGFELYYGLMKEHLVMYGILSENQMERYSDGSIENLDITGVSRVCWMEAEITIPAGESVTLNATFEKEPSFDFHCAATENKGVSGYDMVTSLGSNLHFTQQTARLEDRGQIKIVRQNFGFDLANGINEVILNMTNPHYYLEVKSIKMEE